MYIKMIKMAEDPDEATQIPCKKGTRQRIRDFGSKGETYDEILNRLLDLGEDLEDD